MCEQQCDTQEIGVIHTLASSLSAKLKCPALAILNHDDDILWYRLYDQGRMVDEYDSTPGCLEGKISKPKGGNAKKLCQLMGSQKVVEVTSILQKPFGDEGYLFAIERHEDLFHALNMPIYSVGLGYEYVDEDDLPPDLSRDDLYHIG